MFIRSSTVLLICVLAKTCFGQDCSDLNTHLGKFLILKGELAVNINSELSIEQSISFMELISENNKLDLDFGIYKFTTNLNEETGYNIFFKILDIYEIYDIDRIDLIVKKLNDVRKQNPDFLDNEEFYQYLDKILNLYYEEKKYNLDRAVVKKEFNNFIIFISLNNYKPLPGDN
jgi:hypothetical protein